MAEESEPKQAAAAPPKKNRSKIVIIALVVILVAVGGGSYFYITKVMAARKPAAEVKKKPATEYADSDVKQVVELQPFIVNLSDTSDARYLRMTVSLGIGESETPEKPNPLFTTKVRNAMISVLTTKTSEQVLSADGKAVLRKELLEAARSVSDEPQVIAIYITDFIVQL
jgi:flagellar FliL protein